jgi:eukaryotic-like serine/threonine-protein kinase
VPAPGTNGNTRAQFGAFEFDFRTGELRKHGTRLRLQEQPARILKLLLSRPGELVTRDQIRGELWPSDVFVDYEHGLHRAVNKLRDTLCDSAAEPQFIETRARAGYRFIFPVTLHSCESTESLVRRDGQLVARTAARRFELRLKARTEFRALAAVGLLLMTLVAVPIYYHHLHESKSLSGKDTVVLAEFSNNTGDPVFDDTLKTALSVALNQSPFFHVLSDSKLATILQMMTRPTSTKLIPELARELCQRAGSKAYIGGSIAALGSQYVLQLKAVNCQSGDTMAQEQVTAAAKEKVINALGDAASKLRAELGESLVSVQKFDVPLEQATTSSLEALKAYSIGHANISIGGGPRVAIPYCERAVELDPNFAIAYLALGALYDDVGASERSQEYFTRAFQLRSRVSEPERLAIEVTYYANVTGELEKAAQMIQEQIATYPPSQQYDDQSFVYANLGQYEKAMELTRRNLLLEPDVPAPHLNAGEYALALQRTDEARQLLHEALARKNDYEETRTYLYVLAFVSSDLSGMAEQQEWFATHPRGENVGLGLAAETEAYTGRLTKARALTVHAVASALRFEEKENAARLWETAALREAAFGNATQARRTAENGLKIISTNREIDAEAALAFAMSGDILRAESLAKDVNNRWPLDTQIQSLWLPTIEARLALDRKDPVAALNELQKASAIELGFSHLYSIYFRGEAYLAARQGAQAAREFQKVLDHSGIVWNCWTGSLAHLGLARAWALQATVSQEVDRDAARKRARAGYEEFLARWKDADPDIPILKQAKAEYAKLH